MKYLIAIVLLCLLPSAAEAGRVRVCGARGCYWVNRTVVTAPVTVTKTIIAAPAPEPIILEARPELPGFVQIQWVRRGWIFPNRRAVVVTPRPLLFWR